jgi:O-antigen/teichoic acid export membrane protein
MFKKIYHIIANKHFLSLAGNVIMSGFGLFTMTLIYRSLSKFDAGIWVFFQSILLLVDTLRSGFLTTAFIKFYAGATEARKTEVAGSSWFIGFLITGLLVFAGLCSNLFAGFISDDGLRLFLKWSGLYYTLSLPWFIATCVIQGEQKFDRLLYLRLCNQGSFIAFIILLIATGNITLINILYVYFLSNLITSVFALSKKWTRITTIGNRSVATIKEIYQFGKYSVGSALSSNLFSTSDTIIINFLLGKPALAIYNLGQTLMQLVEIPLRSFAATCMPALASAYNHNNRAQVIQIMMKYAGMLVICLIPAAIIGCLLADVPIYFIGGGKYAGTEAANVFRLFLTFAILFPPDRFFALTLDVIHQPKVNFYKVLVMLAVNIAGDFIGYGISHNVYGIAFSTVLPIITGTIIGYVALNKYQKFSYLNIFKVGYEECTLVIKQAFGKRKIA